MPASYPSSPDLASGSPRWDRATATAKIVDFEQARRERATSQRAFATEEDIPRTTLQHWLLRKASLGGPTPSVVAFFESPDGLAFLHRLVLAARFVITELVPGGIRPLGVFLQLSQLDTFVASSYGALQSQGVAMEEAIVEFGSQKRERLGQQMESRTITVCQDETFHPEVCLVAIEPVSDFIVLEAYARRRDAGTWDEQMAGALAGLQVEVIQSTSDEARGLLHYVEEDLGIHHSPDVMHVQHEASLATSVALSVATRRAQAVCDKLAEQKQALMAAQDALPQESRQESSAADSSRRIGAIENAQQASERVLEQARERQNEARGAIRAISERYHPFDLASGAPRSAEQVQRELEEHFGVLEEVAREGSLGERAKERIAKARRVVGQMAATIAFVHQWLTQCVAGMQLPEGVPAMLVWDWIAGRYLQMVAGKVKGAARRAQIRARAEELLASFFAVDGPLSGMPERERRRIWTAIETCAGLFQRSSSCVEGRNGQLALRHHGLHRLSGRKLAVLTAIHNYFIRRADGTTAAQRFFGLPHESLFEYLVTHLSLPPRPAQRRSKAA